MGMTKVKRSEVQLSLFDFIYFKDCIKSVEQSDIDYLVRQGSNTEKGKLRILAYYNLNRPSLSDFAKFLAKEYGQGGWGHENRSADCSSKGVRYKCYDRKYSFSWKEFAGHVAKAIEAGEYVSEKDLPKDEYFKIPNQETPYGYLRKSYHFCDAYYGKIIVAYLMSLTEEQVKGVRWFKDYSHVNDHVDISLHEILDGIDSGTYDSVDEIWEDIRFSGRRIAPAAVGGRLDLDTKAVQRFFDAYKRTGYAMGSKSQNPLYGYPRFTTHEGLFFRFRQRVKKGEVSRNYFDSVHGKCELEI